MNIESLAALAPALAPVSMPTPASEATTPATGAIGFTQLVRDGLAELDGQLRASGADLLALARGDANDLHRVMLRLEETRLNFQLMLQLRNRAIESYQDLMRMQI